MIFVSLDFRGFTYGFILSLIVLLLSACERSHPQVQALLQHADALMEAHPDSAFSLLDSLHYRQPMSSSETARYALLLAKATDKTYQSLIPCDSLLNFALRYYQRPTAERATALLYKGRLEYEVNHAEDAIKHVQNALLILRRNTLQRELIRHCLSTLGNLYIENNYHGDALESYKELLEFSDNNKDMAIANYGISSSYSNMEIKDSAIYYGHKAVNLAELSKDESLICDFTKGLGITYIYFDMKDSALFYIDKAIDAIPKTESYGAYYYLKGHMLLDVNYPDIDSIQSTIQTALKDTLYHNKYLIHNVLSLLNEKRGNYEAAYNHLKVYTDAIDSMYVEEQSVDVQQLIYDYNTKLQVQNVTIEKERLLSVILCTGVIVIAIIISIYQSVFYRKKKKQLELQRNLDLGIEEISYLTCKINDNEKEIDQLNTNLVSLNKTIEDIQKEYDEVSTSYQEIKKQYENVSEDISHEKTLTAEANEKLVFIKEKYQEAMLLNENMKVSINRYEVQNELLKNEIHNIRTHLFKKTDIYLTIQKLKGIRAKDLKASKVLNNLQRESLRNVIFDLYNDYIQELRNNYPHFTDDDVLLICLKESGLESVDIALCFGYIDTKAINQRIYRIRKAGYEI